MKEKFRKKHVNARLIVKLVDKVRAGFALRYTGLDNTIYGAYFLDEDETTRYKGSLTGFAAGLHYGDGPLMFGASYTAPTRGKISVNSEQLIATESGFINLDIGYGEEKDWRWAFAAKRWLHKSDDRSKSYDVPDSDDEISLNGVSVEQNLYPVIKYSLGADTPYFGDFFFRCSLSQTEYVFLFDDGAVPGDDPDQETELKSMNLKLAAVYSPSDFAIHIGYSYEERNRDAVDDVYKDYHAEDKTLFAVFSYKH